MSQHTRTTLTCSACAREFACGAASGHCWCAGLPVAAISDPTQACLCPACLGQRTGATLADLAGLGPQSQAMLAAAGIDSIARLAQLGPVAAYHAVKQHTPSASLNLLWALAGALSGRRWQDVARDQRTGLLLDLERLAADGTHSADTTPA